jgi:protein farnesyltransferase subunit beta
LHLQYLKGATSDGLSKWFVSLDASKPWIVYWILHALDLLGERDDDVFSRAIKTLESCIHPDGGFSGGNGQIAHLATTYAAVSALAIIGTKDAFALIDQLVIL